MVIAGPPATAPAAPVSDRAVVTTASPSPHGWSTHRVLPGETLVGLAATFRTTPEVLARRNHITHPRHLWAGSMIAVPRPAPAAPAHRTRSHRVVRGLGTHVVRSGETLSGIAARYRMTLPALAKANHVDPHAFIYPGQRLRVRGGTPTSHPATRHTGAGRPGRAMVHVVRSGETLSGIAARFGTSVPALAKANRVSPRAFIHPGQRLAVRATPDRTQRVRAPRSSGRAATPSSTAYTAAHNYPRAVVESARRNRELLGGVGVPSRFETRRIIVQTARRHGVDPRLALAVAMQESGWNQRQVSHANAIGVMQVIPSAGRWASELVGRRLNLLEARDNVTAGVVMLRALGRSTGSETLTVAAYYQGLYSVQQRGLLPDTRLYVSSVRALKARM